MITKISAESKESIVKKMLTKHFYDLNRRLSSPLPDNLIEKIIDDSMIDMHWIKAEADDASIFCNEALEFFLQKTLGYSLQNTTYL